MHGLAYSGGRPAAEMPYDIARFSDLTDTDLSDDDQVLGRRPAEPGQLGRPAGHDRPRTTHRWAWLAEQHATERRPISPPRRHRGPGHPRRRSLAAGDARGLSRLTLADPADRRRQRQHRQDRRAARSVPSTAARSTPSPRTPPAASAGGRRGPGRGRRGEGRRSRDGRRPGRARAPMRTTGGCGCCTTTPYRPRTPCSSCSATWSPTRRRHHGPEAALPRRAQAAPQLSEVGVSISGTGRRERSSISARSTRVSATSRSSSWASPPAGC